MKMDIVVSDPPWEFGDKLTMSDVKRGAESNYSILKDSDIVNLDVKSIVSDNAILALCVPSSKIDVGLSCLNSWGFKIKQTWIWCKVKKDPFVELKKEIKSGKYDDGKPINEILDGFNLQNLLSFGMGRLFRQVHEIVLIGTRGKVYDKLMNKSQRSLYFWPIGKHSEKPEGLQDQLDIMFPSSELKRLEMFARRQRKGWLCLGDENAISINEDIRDSIKKLNKLEYCDELITLVNDPKLDVEKLKNFWSGCLI